MSVYYSGLTVIIIVQEETIITVERSYFCPLERGVASRSLFVGLVGRADAHVDALACLQLDEIGRKWHGCSARQGAQRAGLRVLACLRSCVRFVACSRVSCPGLRFDDKPSQVRRTAAPAGGRVRGESDQTYSRTVLAAATSHTSTTTPKTSTHGDGGTGEGVRRWVGEKTCTGL